jgi:hypothetical protein
VLKWWKNEKTVRKSCFLFWFFDKVIFMFILMKS